MEWTVTKDSFVMNARGVINYHIFPNGIQFSLPESTWFVKFPPTIFDVAKTTVKAVDGYSG
ncbi:unnamed protein product [Arabis nemorensis]|uniref:Uncharacterized protein n=1 Tax=Arabis nemorensis TaxID=586526 RepID=A0A565AQG9_9BRAS|nr:unnamed protein product [Arabis nemorensis]